MVGERGYNHSQSSASSWPLIFRIQRNDRLREQAGERACEQVRQEQRVGHNQNEKKKTNVLLPFDIIFRLFSFVCLRGASVLHVNILLVITSGNKNNSNTTQKQPAIHAATSSCKSASGPQKKRGLKTNFKTDSLITIQDHNNVITKSWHVKTNEQTLGRHYSSVCM